MLSNDSKQPGILVADDEEGIRAVLNLALREHGFAVWLASSEQEAVEAYRRHRGEIAVVLSDGPRIIAALKALNPEIRCCFMSGNVGRFTKQELLELGAARVIEKPFKLTEVVRVLRWLVDSA